jgi:hypothetical protein
MINGKRESNTLEEKYKKIQIDLKKGIDYNRYLKNSRENSQLQMKKKNKKK